MRFDFAGSQFQIEFQRTKKDVVITRRIKDQQTGDIITTDTIQPSQHPYTIVRLTETKPGVEPHVLVEASVGCAPMDRFSVSEGRVQALRKLTRAVPDKAFRKAIWEAYSLRGVTCK